MNELNENSTIIRSQIVQEIKNLPIGLFDDISKSIINNLEEIKEKKMIKINNFGISSLQENLNNLFYVGFQINSKDDKNGIDNSIFFNTLFYFHQKENYKIETTGCFLFRPKHCYDNGKNDYIDDINTMLEWFGTHLKQGDLLWQTFTLVPEEGVEK